MAPSILLTDQEAQLRQLLLDTSEYINSIEGCKRPELRFTGGWVRDKLLGSTSNDIDISIDTMTGFRFGTLMKQYLARPEAKSKYDRNVLGGLAKIEANPEKSKHLETVTTKILGLEIDLVNLRKETYSEDSRNPIMVFGTPQEDALRRDATVNALFYNLSTSQVEDFTERGLRDMEKRVIKTPLAPLQTFKDDPLRILRAIRFASRLEYQIDPEDEIAMSDNSIKEALRLKISRERVGVEITKMLRGPHPHTALRLLDRLGLYNTIFTDPGNREGSVVNTDRWSGAYDLLFVVCIFEPNKPSNSSPLKRLKEILVRNANDTFSAWMLTCFVPWARVSPKLPEKPSSKKPLSSASLAAREGIKADNKICKIVDDSVLNLPKVIGLKDIANAEAEPAHSHLKRKHNSVGREVYGQAIRGWGSDWRGIVMYALLTEFSEANGEEESNKVLQQYASWLSELQSLDLLDVDHLKPLVNGNQLSQALGVKSGPWMKKALDIAMDWQLRNPDETDPAGGIAEVKERKKELGLF